MSPIALHKIQNEGPESSCASMHSGQQEVTVKISSEADMIPKITTSYNVRNDHLKLSVTINKDQELGHLRKTKKSHWTQI
jgi:hypothetical protein